MLEIPESKNISRQVENELIGKTIAEVINATSPHRFTWYNGDPLKYNQILVGREIEASKGHGAFVDIYCDQNTTISISDGVNIRPLNGKKVKSHKMPNKDIKSVSQ